MNTTIGNDVRFVQLFDKHLWCVPVGVSFLYVMPNKNTIRAYRALYVFGVRVAVWRAEKFFTDPSHFERSPR